MSKNPPHCNICEKNCNDKLDRCYYCICDTFVCDVCINSIKKSDTTWSCPNCSEERNLNESMLFRDQ